jgi:hypothetical protein
MAQEFELPAIKVNNDKIEVSTTVSKPETDLSTKITELSDKFECGLVMSIVKLLV